MGVGVSYCIVCARVGFVGGGGSGKVGKCWYACGWLYHTEKEYILSCTFQVIYTKGKSHIALNPSRRCLTCGAKWTFCRTGPKIL